ncbi:MAG: thiamine pyrophosphate-dependent enzyme [Spirochaetia bacterium]|jgi:3D-(3,5/4)-trihydroxycyclohexane-1,2-dione acylhydrolase (decyclizing)
MSAFDPKARAARAALIAEAGGLQSALSTSKLAPFQDVTLSEALVLGLLKQEVRKFIGVFGHGTTDLGEALRVYEEAGLLRVFNVRNEIEASHAAAALRWQYGETPAVFTSIGPGALQALAASIMPLSNGIGVYYIFGDETTHDEGFNMQQIPRHEQLSFLKLASVMGTAYSLQTPEALPAALRRGANAVFNPYQPVPCYLLLPMNVQGQLMKDFNLNELPSRPSFSIIAPIDEAPYRNATELIRKHDRILVKVGNGARGVDSQVLSELLDRADAVFVHGPSAVGILHGSHQRNMTVGGSKGSMPGNYAMEQADLVIVIGARAVCQWDSSGTAWKSAKAFISINTRIEDATHYNRSLPLVGDANAVVGRIVESLRAAKVHKSSNKDGKSSEWLLECRRLREEWDVFLTQRCDVETLHDQKWGRALLTQPAAIKTVMEFADEIGAVKYFDAGDVQANGFQLIEDDHPGQTFTDTGASYMGFAVSGILCTAFAEKPHYPIAFTGDGSFMMNPQILIDAVQHRLRGMIVLFDNRRMAAITGLQIDQYGRDFRTDDSVDVDYVAMANSIKGVRAIFGGYSRRELKASLAAAATYEGLSLLHVPVYAGPDERGGLGVYGRWNVGNWCEEVQREKHRLGH